MPGIPHSFGCKATDWLRGISSLKKIKLGVSVVIFGWSLHCSGA